MISDELKKLLADIDLFTNDKDHADALEQRTLSIISLDEFESLPEDIQQAVYTLDSRELNELKTAEILSIRGQITSYVQKHES